MPVTGGLAIGSMWAAGRKAAEMRLEKRLRVVLVVVLGVIALTALGLPDHEALPRAALYDPFALRPDHPLGQAHQPHHSAADHAPSAPAQ